LQAHEEHRFQDHSTKKWHLKYGKWFFKRIAIHVTRTNALSAGKIVEDYDAG